MTLTKDEMTSSLLALPQNERAELAELLLESLGTPPGVMEEDSPELDAALDRRLAEYESGIDCSIPGEVFLERLRRGNR